MAAAAVMSAIMLMLPSAATVVASVASASVLTVMPVFPSAVPSVFAPFALKFQRAAAVVSFVSVSFHDVFPPCNISIFGRAGRCDFLDATC